MCHPSLENSHKSVGVPDGIRTRVLALKGPRPRPLDDGDSEGERNTKSYHGGRGQRRASGRRCGAVPDHAQSARVMLFALVVLGLIVTARSRTGQFPSTLLPPRSSR